MAETTDLAAGAPAADQLSEADQAFTFWTTLSPGAERAVMDDAARSKAAGGDPFSAVQAAAQRAGFSCGTAALKEARQKMDSLQEPEDAAADAEAAKAAALISHDLEFGARWATAAAAALDDADDALDRTEQQHRDLLALNGLNTTPRRVAHFVCRAAAQSRWESWVGYYVTTLYDRQDQKLTTPQLAVKILPTGVVLGTQTIIDPTYNDGKATTPPTDPTLTWKLDALANNTEVSLTLLRTSAPTPDSVYFGPQLQGTIKFGDPADWDLDATRFPKSGTYRIAGRLGDPAAQGGSGSGSGGSGGDPISWVDVAAVITAAVFAIPGLISAAYMARKYFGSSRVHERLVKQTIRKALMEESPFEVNSRGVISRKGGNMLVDMSNDIQEHIPNYKAFVKNAGNLGKAFQSDLWEVANRLEVYNSLQAVEKATQAGRELRQEIDTISARLRERMKRDAEERHSDEESILEI
ncbi:MAG: hypothetical protein JNM75_03435 [Rhodospirillales bacterium]|nr:hypothetical protein [Rhodospirillales bacterium]